MVNGDNYIKWRIKKDYEAGLWLQDRWQLRPRLLIELGGRFDRQRMPAGISSSSSNLSPRAGLAWRPSAKRPLVIRAGFGLFFDRYPLAFLNEALQKDGRLGFEQFAAGPPAAAALTLSRGAILTADALQYDTLGQANAADAIRDQIRALQSLLAY